MGRLQTKHSGRLGRLFRPALLLAVFAVAAPCALERMAFPFQSQVASEDDTVRKLKIASTQHDLILLLIDSKSFDRVEQEWKKVLDLELGSKYEGAVAKSLESIALKLYDGHQLALALKLLDESLAAVPFSNSSKADLYKLKAAIYKELGDLDSAIQAYKHATELMEK